MPHEECIYVFELASERSVAFSVDKTGGNIPVVPRESWFLMGMIDSCTIDEADADRFGIRHALVSDGYYLLSVPEELLAS